MSSSSDARAPYVWAITVIAVVAIIGGVVVIVLRGTDNAQELLLTNIFGFAVTVTMATLAYLRATETHAIVNSRMDEFKAVLELNANQQSAIARAAGIVEGEQKANLRTDALAATQQTEHH